MFLKSHFVMGLIRTKNRWEWRRFIRTRCRRVKKVSTANSRQFAVLYHHHNQTAFAEEIYRRALDAVNKIDTKANPEVGLIINNLGRLMQDQGKFAEAAVLYQQSLETLEKRLGADHPRLATPLINAALLSLELGDHCQAKRLFGNAIAILGGALGPEHPKVLKARMRLREVEQRISSITPAVSHSAA
jgi:Tfp pilus assembly protein PilF